MMGGKSRKTGGVSKELIDRIKRGGKLPERKDKKQKQPQRDPFGLNDK
jgi:hypothetical protein